MGLGTNRHGDRFSNAQLGAQVTAARKAKRTPTERTIYAKVDNVFDNHYYTYGTFFETDDLPNYANGGNAFTDPRSLTPARPRAFYAGMKVTF